MPRRKGLLQKQVFIAQRERESSRHKKTADLPQPGCIDQRQSVLVPSPTAGAHQKDLQVTMNRRER